MRPNFVSRPKLFDRLNTGAASKLTLICAPAGFGKTSLLAAWLKETGKQAAWISLDAEDNEPANVASITATIKDIQITGMENHYYPLTGKYYFPGMYTAILPMIPGIYSIWRLFNNRCASVSLSETVAQNSVLVPAEASN